MPSHQAVRVHGQAVRLPAECNVKTLAIRLEDDVHAQLSVLAQLRESTITEEIRMALESHLETSKSSVQLSDRAQTVLDEIQRESEGRKAAIASLFGTPELRLITGEPTGSSSADEPSSSPVQQSQTAQPTAATKRSASK